MRQLRLTRLSSFPTKVLEAYTLTKWLSGQPSYYAYSMATHQMNETNENASLQTNFPSSQNNVLDRAKVKRMLMQMLSFQDELNKKLNLDWKNAGYLWSDAILLESAELFDHLPWKWWKTYSGDVNWGQIQLEAVDIWHFMMSQIIEGATDETLDALVEAFEAMKDPNASVEAVKTTVRHFMKSIQDDMSDFDFEYYSLPAFCNVLSTVGLSFEALYKLYVSKVKLNEFRWKNGYGSKYIKDWLGQEDNEYLTQLVEGLNVDDPEFAEKITAGLEARYQEVLAAQAKKDKEKQEQYVKHIEEIL